MSLSALFPFSPLLFTSLLLLAGCVSDVMQIADDMRVRTRIGVLADTEIGKGANLSAIEKAFAFYRQQKVDAVVLTGTVTQNGNSAQIGTLNRLWEKVFKGSSVKLIALDDLIANKRASGRPKDIVDAMTLEKMKEKKNGQNSCS